MKYRSPTYAKLGYLGPFRLRVRVSGKHSGRGQFDVADRRGPRLAAGLDSTI